MTNESKNVNDIIEMVNYFRCIDYIIEQAKSLLSGSLIKSLHYILKSGSSDVKKEWFAVGE